MVIVRMYGAQNAYPPSTEKIASSLSQSSHIRHEKQKKTPLSHHVSTTLMEHALKNLDPVPKTFHPPHTTMRLQ